MNPPPLAREEDVPLGVVRDWHADPVDRACARCGAQLEMERHRPDCPVNAEIFFSTIPASRAEEVLQACTMKAFLAAIAAGGRP